MQKKPPRKFPGLIGKTLQTSIPHWEQPKLARDGSPNIVLILFDDLGFSDFGCFGGEIPTPSIDRLAKQGARFTQYTTVPMCTPARAALLSGKNPHAVGCGWLSHNNPGFPGYAGGEISLNAPTMPEILRDAGYSTMAVGKWHNTYVRNAHPGGNRSSWPLQRGFDRFYGFLASETSYFRPDGILEGNQLSQRDAYPTEYFSTDDFTDRLLSWMKEHVASSPEKPFFAYFALQAPHIPLHAKPEDLQRHAGRYSQGWDELRKERFERQQTLGVIEANAALPPRNPGVPAWDSLVANDRALFARYMECYAALVDNADQNIGRIIDFLGHSGRLDNTLILITSDNGASSLGGSAGSVNILGSRQGWGEDSELGQELLNSGRVGSDDTYPAYNSGWAQLCNTPYRYYKRTPMAGGIRVPFVAHFPTGIERPGNREQWVHVTDVLPMILDVAGVSYPERFGGEATTGMDGISFVSALSNPKYVSSRASQHYELEGNRGFIKSRWKIVSLQPPGTAINLDNWMLFDLENDPTEINDLAGERPDVLSSMITAFEDDADANLVYPLDNRLTAARSLALPPFDITAAHSSRTFFKGAQTIPAVILSPMIGDRSFVIEALFKYTDGAEGVIYSIGDRFAGYASFVKDGQLTFVCRRRMKPMPLPPLLVSEGENHFLFELQALGKRRCVGNLSLNGKQIAEGLDLSPTLLRLPSGGLDVGIDRRGVSSLCSETGGSSVYSYSDEVKFVRIVPGAFPPDSVIQGEEEIQIRTRSAPAA